MNETRTVWVDEGASGTRRFHALVKGHTPSWKRFGDGASKLEVTIYAAGHHANIKASETLHPSTAVGHKGSHREVMLNLDLDEQRALVAFLSANIKAAEFIK